MLARVAPGPDQREARAEALADEVDRPVAELAPRELELVDPLRNRVPGKVDALVAEAVGAGAEGGRLGFERGRA
jgi:hypothetical protein